MVIKHGDQGGMKILVIEDDQLVADTLVELLIAQTHAVEIALDGASGQDLLQTYEYDLVILDLTLPKIDGISLCQQIRSQGSQVPVLILTGQDDHHQKAIGLDAGADDYVVKPFDPEELLARVRALLRRSGEITPTVLHWGNLQLDPSSCQVTYGDRPVTLTPKEYALTELFLRNPKRVFSCSAILDHLWAYEEAPGEEAVRTHIKGLRQKLKAADAGSDLIETVYGIGYRLRSTAIPDPPSSMSPDDRPSVKDHRDAEMQAKIQQIWLNAQARVQLQLDTIQDLCTCLADPAVPNHDLLQNATQAAHMLAGSLGTFGFTQGSQYAKQIETILKTTIPPHCRLTELQTCLTGLRQGIQPAPPTTSNAASSPPLDQRPRLLVIDADRNLSRRLSQDVAFSSFQIVTAPTLAGAEAILKGQTPQVILFDPDVAPKLEHSLQFLNQLHQSADAIPTVIFTLHTELLERRNLLRSGGSVFLPKPATPAQILAALQQALERSRQLRSQVLVVDDDPTILHLTQHLLQPWGLHVTVLADPKQFWQVLEATQPDLLILDILMPDVSGIELCQVVRGDVRWSELPIVILTAQNDADTINQVFSVGADDFVAKPIVGPELVTRIINRLERMKLIQRRYGGTV
jgi:DNA-binding response OmpR family regulator/HPt (histidine-containing phosphotransfer) domain-containing protein